MATTEKDLQEKRNSVEKLREQIAAEQDKRAEHARQAQVEVEAAELDAEIVRLQRLLDAEKAETAAQVEAKRDAAKDATAARKEASATATGRAGDTDENKKEN